jgi:hypothetical protein
MARAISDGEILERLLALNLERANAAHKLHIQ